MVSSPKERVHCPFGGKRTRGCCFGVHVRTRSPPTRTHKSYHNTSLKLPVLRKYSTAYPPSSSNLTSNNLVVSWALAQNSRPIDYKLLWAYFVGMGFTIFVAGKTTTAGNISRLNCLVDPSQKYRRASQFASRNYQNQQDKRDTLLGPTFFFLTYSRHKKPYVLPG